MHVTTSPSDIEVLDFDPFAAGPIERVIGSTEAQREIWLADRIAPEASLAYNESVSLILRGPLNAQALRATLDAVVARHESLRATVSADGMQLLINTPAPCELAMHELTALNAAARQSARERARAQAVETPFDLAHGPLFRAVLLRCEPALHELLLTAHHIVCDGWSWGRIAEDIGLLYAQALALGHGPALPVPARYEDYVHWEDAEAHSPAMQEHTRFWVERFAGGTPPTAQLPADRPRPASRTFASRRLDLLIDKALVENVRQLGARHGVSLFGTLFGVFAGTLQRLTQQADLVIGVPAAGQPVSGMPALVGHCVNLLPIRIQVDPELDMRALIQASGQTLLDAFDHSTLTYGLLLKKLQLPRDPSRPTLVSVMFNLDQETVLPDGAFPGLAVELVGNPRHFENFELFLNATPTAKGLRLECQYNTGLFDEASVRRWLALFSDALRRFAADPGLSVAQAYALGEDERALLASFNASEAPWNSTLRIEVLIATQAAATPQAIAVVAGPRQLSYRQLDQRANALAWTLQTQGVGAGQLVGLSCTRDEHMLVALLGILKAGAGYVPLDPAFPHERLDFMAQDARLSMVVVDAGTESAWAGQTVQCVRADTVAQADIAPTARGSADDVAYVIYTSGSTGRPKGVRVPHRSVVNLLTSLRSIPGMRADHVVLAVTTLSFDIAVSEVIMPLTIGARVVVADKAQAGDGERLRALVEREQINFIDATPATWRLLLEAGWPGRRDLLAICTGEPLPPDLARQLLPCVGALWNGYGPTETTVWSSFHKVERVEARVPIGRPLANTAFHVLDGALRPLPVGVAGELYIAGAGVTLGYLNRPELTAERFLPAPGAAEPAPCWYKTGDLGRWRADGLLECLGRADHQVKVRGYRIELGEIESNLASHPAVAQTFVITREDAPGDVRIVAYVVPRGAMPEAAQLKRHLCDFLPEYMLPQHFVALTALPLLPTGKVDRKALPAPDVLAQDPARVRVEPANALEGRVLGLMEQALSLPGLSMDDDFFAVGGHSLLAARLMAALGRAFDMKLSLAMLFESPTALRLSRAIAQAQARGAAPSAERIEHRADQRSAPLTPMQERIRFIEELHPGRPVYNVPSGHRLRGPLNLPAFEATLREIVRHQPVLRCVIGLDPETGQPAQFVQDAIEFVLPVEDLRVIAEPLREATLLVRMQAIADTCMDIHRGPLFRMALYRLAEEEHALVFVPHHLIWDGWSFDVFQADLAAIYTALSQGRPNPLPELAITYGDYTSWYNRWLTRPEAQGQLRYWKRRFAQLPPTLAPRTDQPRRAGMTGQGRSCFLRIDPVMTERLRDVAREHNVTLNMLTLGLLALMMRSAIGTPSVVIATPVRGREAPELEAVMGFFNNLIPVPFEIQGTQPLGEFLKDIKRELMASMDHQQIPFERLAAEPEFSRRTQGGTLYQALFSFQDARERPGQLGALHHEQIHIFQRGATDDFGLWLMDKADGLSGAITYNVDIYLRETGEAFRNRYIELLHKAVQMPNATLDEIAAPGDSKAAKWLRRLAPSIAAPAPSNAPTDTSPAPAKPTSGELLMPEHAWLAQIWASVLGMDVNDIRPNDNFFDLGGDSLLAMRAVQQAEQTRGFRIEARRYVFESLAQLAASHPAPPLSAESQPTESPRGLIGRMLSALARR